MRHRLHEWLAWVDALTLRERAAIGAAALIVLWGAWTFVAWDDIEATRTHTQQRLEAARAQLAELARRSRDAAEATRADPDAALREERDRLLRQLETLEADRAARAGELITPEQMVGTLRELLARQEGLTLEKLELQAPVSALASESSATFEGAAPFEPGSVPLYKHAVELEWLGGYLETLRYLRAVERLGWAIYWESLDYEVVRHPEARVRLRLFTLSEHEGWIGV